ncbi:hypothetical protein [Actinokineospora terrae]|uniref:Uncharacterized protein n=1 Tax=Actinokineospora terrae TaxID=155974 RepID=A0A1H9X3J9_9PSEU|nr:hypothetical protein [Actinokineospora terrae]SES40762.1 hypothetical protein SAMN04487818_112242 [Actinokineospora terrae]
MTWGGPNPIGGVPEFTAEGRTFITGVVGAAAPGCSRRAQDHRHPPAHLDPPAAIPPQSSVGDYLVVERLSGQVVELGTDARSFDPGLPDRKQRWTVIATNRGS